ncbi:unnamed protein product, partial [Meganyctiphanes norvegica]
SLSVVVMASTHTYQQFWGEFIDMYRSFPSLWNVGSNEYNNRKLKRDNYDMLIGKIKEIDPEADRQTVTKKINSLRCNYRRELRKMISTGFYIPSLWYFDKLTFLYDQENGGIEKGLGGIVRHKDNGQKGNGNFTLEGMSSNSEAWKWTSMNQQGLANGDFMAKVGETHDTHDVGSLWSPQIEDVAKYTKKIKTEFIKSEVFECDADSKFYESENIHFGAESRDHGAGSTDYGSGSRDYCAEIRDYGAENRDFGAESRDLGAESRDYGDENRHFGAESRDLGTERDTGAELRDGTESRDYGAERKEYGAESSMGKKVDIMEQKAEITEQKAEIMGQKAEIMEQRVEIVEQKSEIMEKKAEIINQKVEILNQKVEILNQDL